MVGIPCYYFTMREFNARETMTAREREEFEQEKVAIAMQAEHSRVMKELDLALAREEAKWGALLRLPSLLIMLPVRMIMGIAYIAAVIKKEDPGKEFWDYMNGRH